jgi:PAS domain S-box-containing protein
MKESIRILFVEDVPCDAELIWHEIAKSGIRFEKELVETRQDYIASLKSFKPDLIISDYMLPQFDGMTALSIKIELIPDIPFILVTGSANEEVAVECMKAGADDYVIKQNIRHIGPSIISALEKYEMLRQKRISEKELRAREAKLSALFSAMTDVIIVVDSNGCHIEIAPTNPDLLYKPQMELVGKTFHEIFPPHQADFFLKHVRQCLEKQGSVEMRYSLCIGDREFWFEAKLTPLSSDAVIMVARDISEIRKKELKRIEELTFISDVARYLNIVVKEEEIHQYICEKIKGLTGNSIVLTSKFEPKTDNIIITAFKGFGALINKAIGVLQFDPTKSRFPVSEMDEEDLNLFRSGKMEYMENGFYRLLHGKVPKSVCDLLENNLGMSFMHVVGFIHNNHHLGGVIIITSSRQEIESNKHIIEAIVSQASAVIHRIHSDDALKESEERYRLLIENQGEGVCIINHDEQFVLANPAAEEMFGVAPGCLVNRDLNDFITAAQIPMELHKATETGSSVKSTYELDITTQEGDKRTLLTTLTPQFSNAGKHTGTFGVFRDITDRKRMVKKIMESEAYYRSLVDISPDGIMISDIKGNIAYGSLKTFEIFAVPPDVKVLGSSFLNWVSPDYHHVATQRVSDILAGNVSPETREYKLLKYDRSVFWGELSSSPLTDSEGNFTGLLISCRDITERKKVADELVEAKERAEESDRLKTAFLHNISHEIRTPMNAIIGFSSLLGDPGLSSETAGSYINTIMQSSNHLLAIVGDIIEISNIEVGILKFYNSEVNLNSVLKNLYNQYYQKAMKKGITFRFKNELSDSDSLLQTDGTKLVQIFSNLLNNALKFTDEGQVAFGYSLKEHYIQFYVSDTGIGIPEDQHERIFDRFYQVDHLDSKQYDGTGLGLSICKAYVEFLGGKIWITSKPGKGTVIYFTLPFIKGEQTEKSVTGNLLEESVPVKEKKTVLIAEDEDNNYNAMADILSRSNLSVLHASNGKEVIQICKSGKKVDLVLMDIKMPVMDGHEATKRLKKLNPGLPVIALTAFAFGSDRVKAKKSGCDEFLSKPVRKNVLLNTIGKYI